MFRTPVRPDRGANRTEPEVRERRMGKGKRIKVSKRALKKLGLRVDKQGNPEVIEAHDLADTLTAKQMRKMTPEQVYLELVTGQMRNPHRHGRVHTSKVAAVLREALAQIEAKH